MVSRVMRIKEQTGIDCGRASPAAPGAACDGGHILRPQNRRPPPATAAKSPVGNIRPIRFHYVWHRILVDVATAVPTAEVKQLLALLLIVNSGGDRRQAERFGHADSGATHLERHLVAAQGSIPCA